MAVRESSAGREDPGQPEYGLFGSEKNRGLLRALHRDGTAYIKRPSVYSTLLSSGLVVRCVVERRVAYAFDHRHPAYAAVLAVLDDLAGIRRRPRFRASVLPPSPAVHPTKPLGHITPAAITVLFGPAASDTALDLDTVKRRIPSFWPKTVAKTVDALIAGGVLTERDGLIGFAPGVPDSYRRLVVLLGEHMGLDPRTDQHGARPVAFAKSTDGAPRLFATDARLRNFMALAKHGPLLVRELRTITGAGHLKLESYRIAQFGRGGVVRTWSTDEGEAGMLDRDYPVYLPLRRLLLAMERVYPLPPYTAQFKAPKPPPRRTWVGDRHALFGDVIPTMILTSIGVHGWTFEALCVALIAGHDRYNIKRSMRRLEDEGVLQGDRARGPGFNTRIVTIAEGFPAKAELEALLRAYVKAWPQTATAVQRAFEKIARERPRGKVHLEKRGLWPY